MKLRIKYSKCGNLKFIGHLDVMRYFQKNIRRAGLKVCYSKGYSPHQIISFAAPLSMCITSDGEYFDGEFEEITSSAAMIDALNAYGTDDLKVSECVLLPDDAKNSMSVVAASDYEVSFRIFADSNNEAEENSLKRLYAEKLMSCINSFYEQDEIITLKKTKKCEREENIKNGILKLLVRDNSIYMLLSTGSEYNLKPELVMKALCVYAGIEYNFFDYYFHRLETYMKDADGMLMPLYKAGRVF